VQKALARAVGVPEAMQDRSRARIPITCLAGVSPNPQRRMKPAMVEASGFAGDLGMTPRRMGAITATLDRDLVIEATAITAHEDGVSDRTW
jgi:hypothetical protein